ncbi:MAG: hypothetical protein ACRDT8_12200 [Micromonosporaceae bacterium]
MSSLLSQLPALIGVVVGAVASYAATSLGDRARFRRNQNVRWQERRLGAYTEYTQAQKRILSLCHRVASHLDVDPHPRPLTLDEATPGLNSASEARDLAWEQLLMLGDRDVVNAGRDWFAVVATMEGFVRDDARDAERWGDLLERQRATRAQFYAAARNDLALPPGHDGRQPVSLDATA